MHASLSDVTDNTTIPGIDLPTLALVTEHADDHVALLDGEGRMVFANPRLQAELERWGGFEAGRTFEDLDLPTPLLERWRVAMESARETGVAQHVEFKSPRGSRQLHGEIVPVLAEGTFQAWLTITSEVLGGGDGMPASQRQALEDPLTGLSNRRGFEQALARLIEDAANTGNSHAMLYIDLDHFKQVNDSCGHGAGDELLRQLPTVIRPLVRGADVVARLGGDEFAILLENCALDGATAVAEKIRDAVRAFRFAWELQTFEIGASIGVVGVDPSCASIDAVMQAADSACYAAKDEGRNCVHVSYPHDLAVIRRRGEMRWLERLRQAIDQDELVLHCQAMADLSDPTMPLNGHEILVRMRDQRGNDILPGSFLPAAERYQLVDKLDIWVVRHAFAAIGELRRRLDPELRFSINIARGSLGKPELTEVIAAGLAEHDIPAEAICIELRETVVSANLGATHDLLREIKALGCQLALDDFGSGVSSFSYLKNLPVNLIKIDGQLIRDLLSSKANEAIVRAINEIAHHLGIKTVAKHVENDGQLAALKAIGVDYAQGNLVAAPRPLASFG